MEKNNFIETRATKIWLTNEGIHEAVVKPNIKMTLNDSKDINEARIKLSGQNKVPFLFDITNIISADRESRIFASSEETSRITKVLAIIVKSSVSKTVGNVFMGINKPVYPIKMFTDKDKALEWIKGYL